MVAAVGARLTQGRLRTLTEGSNALVSQAHMRTVYNFPSVEMRSSQMRMRGLWGSGPMLEVSQARVRAIIKGRADNHRVRAWAYSLDGHDFYVIQLGEIETLVCDLKTGEWSRFRSPDRATWRACLGMNWTGIGQGLLTSMSVLNNVVAGDDGFGLIWIMAPEQGYDQSPLDASEQAFTRIAMGGVAMRMRETARCDEAYLLANKGTVTLSVTAPTVQLQTSDDAEATWDDQGTITVAADDFSQEFAWRSLGLIGAPGRVFEVTDNCLQRIDGMEMR